MGEKVTYRVTVVCKNCGNKPDMILEWGVKVKQYLERVKGGEQAICPNCGCDTLKTLNYG